MYKNLEAELARNSISKKEISIILGRAYTTTLSRFNGNSDFSIQEALLIKKELFPDKTLEYLFES